MLLNRIHNLLHKFIVILGFMALITVISGAKAQNRLLQEVQTVQVPSPVLIPSPKNQTLSEAIYFTSEKK